LPERQVQAGNYNYQLLGAKKTPLSLPERQVQAGNYNYQLLGAKKTPLSLPERGWGRG
jgi:hypothetical protein